ncbi:MAG: aldo/keto reductase [Microbacterium sp. 67-17]|nr:MAG: aldo/keto reductase [Microbacterium sp. 67-17]
MRTRALGTRGPVVSSVGLGTMSLPLHEGERTATRIVHAALDAGITLIDTADVYGDGAVEELLGRVLGARRDDVVLATKVGLPMGGDPTRAGASARWIERAVDDSLRRLRTDRIDLYQLHRPDPATPLEETVTALERLRAAGKIRWSGSSVFPAEMLVEAQWVAERTGAAPMTSEQAPYSILVRGIERAVLPAAESHGIGVIAWGPLNGGWLTGKYRRGAEPPAGSRAAQGNPFVRADDERKLAVTEQLRRVADDAGLTLTELSLGWVGEHPGITSVLIGPRTPEQLTELLTAADTALDAPALDAIDAIVAPGTSIDPRNEGWTPPGLSPEARRGGRGSEGVEGQ